MKLRLTNNLKRTLIVREKNGKGVRPYVTNQRHPYVQASYRRPVASAFVARGADSERSKSGKSSTPAPVVAEDTHTRRADRSIRFSKPHLP